MEELTIAQLVEILSTRAANDDERLSPTALRKYAAGEYEPRLPAVLRAKVYFVKLEDFEAWLVAYRERPRAKTNRGKRPHSRPRRVR